ncbi:MAG: hypothetical protein HFG00_02825 [Oscillibacter sp.]|nr:hypothetical protein [Oscillibacter sp.]
MVVYVIQYRPYNGAELKVYQEAYQTLESAHRFIESRPNRPEKEPCTNFHYRTETGEEYHISEVSVRTEMEV